MKTPLFVLAALVSLFTYSLQAKTLIVSDVDDTIKVTNVLSKTEIFYNALFSKRDFAGMSTLYKALEEKDTTFYYVSGSPRIITSKIESFLRHNNFPQTDNVITRRLSEETFDYKVGTIKSLIKEINPDEVILIGDDTEVDPEVYDTVFKAHPDLVKAIYIRAIRNRELPANELMSNYFAATEIAGKEYLRGNLLEEAIESVSKSFVENKDQKEFFIEGRYCPEEGRTVLDEIKQQVTEESTIVSLDLTQEKIMSICQ